MRLVVVGIVAAMVVGGGRDASGQVAYWKLDEISGLIASSDNGNNGTLEQPNPQQNNWLPSGGIVGGALNFQNVWRINFDDSSVGETERGTLEAWFNLSNTANAQAIFSKVYDADTDSAQSYGVPSRLLSFGDNRLGFCIVSGYKSKYENTITTHWIETDPAQTGNFTTGQWFHVAATWGSRGMEIFLDGQLRVSNTYTGWGETSNIRLMVGDDWPDQLFEAGTFEGLLDEVAIYSRQLSGVEIARHYQDGLEHLGYEVFDTDGDGYLSDVDCDDNNANVNPGAIDLPFDGIDNDCDGSVDNIHCEVTNTNDSGPGSLRHAMLYANTYPGPDTITFNIPGSGPHTIHPLTPFPAITDPVTIDGYTQPGAAQATDSSPATLLIELDGINQTELDWDSGLNIWLVGNSTIRGLVINRFGDVGIHIHDGGGNIIEGNYIGTDVTGTQDKGNYDGGIRIWNAPNNRIGGTSPAARNVISGNGGAAIGILLPGATGNEITGNYIGTNASGTAALGNAVWGVLMYERTSNNTIGPDNVISGNGGAAYGGGVEIGGEGTTTNHLVVGNLIGTDVSGTMALGNTFGVRLLDCSGNTVEDNIVSNSTIVGITVAGDPGVFPSGNNTVTGNTVSFNSGFGLQMEWTDDNTVYNNSFINNGSTAGYQVVDHGGSGNIFSLDEPIGGNYWSDWTGPDNDCDGFVDSPYLIWTVDPEYGNQDNLPLAHKDGLNTPEGSNIEVALEYSTVAITFSQVNGPGNTSLTTSDTGPTPPEGFELAGKYYDITTTASYSPPVIVKINYDDSGMTVQEEEALRLFHYEGGVWVDETDLPVDTGNNIIFCTVNALSPFAVFAPIEPSNQAPAADAGPDQTVEQASADGTEVTLDGSGSSDPDEDALTYSWTWVGGTAIGVNPTILLPPGTTDVTLVVNDGTEDSLPDQVSITVQDTTPPEIDLSEPVPSVLWPVNHKFVDVVIAGFTLDICDADLDIDVSVEVIDADGGDGGPEHDPDYGEPIVQIDGEGLLTILVALRAERSGKGTRRIYEITAVVTDDSGNTASATAEVTVPHDQGKGGKK